MKKAALIGLGDISPIHIEVLKKMPEVRLASVCDIDMAKQKHFNGISFYTDYREMMETEKPDCVHICLPHYLHYPAACEAVARGIHVFCEKPLAISREEADAFRQLERMHPEVAIGICLQNRKNETVRQLKQIIERGEHGAVTGLRGFVPWQRDREYYAAKPWRGRLAEAGSGVLLNQSIHTLDLLYYLGGNVRTVKAIAGQLLDYGIEVEDTVAARLGFENGAAGLFFATNSNDKNQTVSIEVTTENGEFFIRDNGLYQVTEDGSRILRTEDHRLTGSKFYYGAGHEAAIREFYRAMEQGSEDYIHVKDAWMGMVLADAILQSAKTGRTASVEAD